MLTPELVHAMLREPFRDYGEHRLQTHLRDQMAARIHPQIDAGECHPDRLSELLEGRYTFAHETHDLGADWLVNPSADIEWHIMLHKFYYAPGLGEAYRRTGNVRYLDRWLMLTRTWIEQTPAGFLAADVTGRRLQNWVYAYTYFAGHLPDAFHCKFLESLHHQTQWLIDNLHESRNHRTLELHALFLVAVAFEEFSLSIHLREFALREIVANLRADLRPDGVHCEQSTEYHHLVLKNYLSVRRTARRNGIAVPAEMDERLVDALQFSMHVHRPDGRIPALSDADVHDYRDLLRQGSQLYARQDMLYVATNGREGEAPACRTRLFADSGYAVMRSGWGARNTPFEDERYLVFDCGPLGDGNHGHLDLLNFEAYAFSQPLIVDPGRYTYHEDTAENWRVRFRSSAYHNTVLVDEKNQTRYEPGPSKYTITGATPRHALRSFVTRDDFDYVRGIVQSHEYAASHERSIAFIDGAYWIIVDTLRSSRRHQYDLLFHLSAAAWRKTGIVSDPETFKIVSPHLLMLHLAEAHTRIALEDGYVSEQYGHKHPAPIVCLRRLAQDTQFVTLLYPFEHELPNVRIRRLAPELLEVRRRREDALCTDIIDMGDSPEFSRRIEVSEPAHA